MWGLFKIFWSFELFEAQGDEKSTRHMFHISGRQLQVPFESSLDQDKKVQLYRSEAWVWEEQIEPFSGGHTKTLFLATASSPLLDLLLYTSLVH